MRFAAAAALAALAACTAAPKTDSQDRIVIVWNRVDDPHAACQKLQGRKEVFAIHGCSKWNETDRSGARVCSIYAPAPKSEADTQAFTTLGHELMHCFDGNWHDRWGRMTPREGEAAAGGTRGR